MSTLPDSFFLHPILLRPHFATRPWGGERLAHVLHKDVPQGGPFGESWELSDHPGGRSLVRIGESTISFGDLLRAHPRAMIGRDVAPDVYPILVKFIDASADLSVQVHPDDAWCAAKNHPDRGKSECWYVMNCEPNTRVIYGVGEGMDEHRLRAAIASRDLSNHLSYIHIKPGDFLAIPPGTVHALLGGTLVCEIQQASNTTFRLHDWDREPARDLHIDESMDVTTFDSTKLPQVMTLGTHGITERPKLLLDNEFFIVELYEFSDWEYVRLDDLAGETGAIVSVVGGAGEFHAGGEEHMARNGETWYLPAAMKSFGVKAEESLRLLVTHSKEL